MTIGLDTSLTLRLLTGVPEAQADVARRLVASSPSPVAISDLVVGETYLALRHHYGVPHGEATRVLHALLSDPRIRGTGVARSILADPESRRSAKSQPGLMDRLIHGDYDREGLAVATFDRALGRLQGAQRLG
ncbi:MAG: hypothetical protein IT359_09865 [Gemmatimonadaceae bacterium]|nr:hypothetical protein [Gemmatimonadaceae bacterium]